MKSKKYNDIMKDAVIIEIKGKKGTIKIELPKINLKLEYMPYYIEPIEKALKEVIESELK